MGRERSAKRDKNESGGKRGTLKRKKDVSDETTQQPSSGMTKCKQTKLDCKIKPLPVKLEEKL